MTKENNFSSSEHIEHKPENKHHLKIELLVCQAGGNTCKEHLKIINERYSEANFFHLEKDYLNSIESLKDAFFITDKLNKDTCLGCAALFRSTIAQSLKNINSELHNLSSGFFRNKKYYNCYVESCNVLNEIKNVE